MPPVNFEMFKNRLDNEIFEILIIRCRLVVHGEASAFKSTSQGAQGLHPEDRILLQLVSGAKSLVRFKSATGI